MRLILQIDGSHEYDLTDELADLDIVVEVDQLVERIFEDIREPVGDDDPTLKFLLASPWEEMQRQAI